jgi:hypothetical protein
MTSHGGGKIVYHRFVYFIVPLEVKTAFNHATARLKDSPRIE